MATRRMIHRSLWQSEDLATCDMTARLLFIGMITNADDQGRLLAHPALLRSMIFPFDDIALETIEHGLRLLEDIQTLILYSVEGKPLAQVANWWKYQKPTWAWPSDHPAPPGWTDRVRYRQGNQVVESNWSGDPPPGPPDPTHTQTTTTPNPTGHEGDAPSVPPDDGASAGPQRPHREPRPEPADGPAARPSASSAPSGSGSADSSHSATRSNSSPRRKKTRTGPAPPGEPQNDTEPRSEQVEEAFRALLAFGIDGAAEIAATYEPDDILAWLRYARDRREDLANPQGLVVRRLQQGRRPPPACYTPSPDLEDWRRFTTDDYAQYLED